MNTPLAKARTTNNPNGFTTDHQSLMTLRKFIERTAPIFGWHIHQINAIPGNYFVNTAALLNQARNLVIRAKKGDRNGVGMQYAEVARQGGIIVNNFEILAAPGDFVVDAFDHETIDLNWDASPDATNYILQRASSPYFTDAAEVFSGAATLFGDTGLAAETTYWYRVKAEAPGFTNSAWSVLSQTTDVAP